MRYKKTRTKPAPPALFYFSAAVTLPAGRQLRGMRFAVVAALALEHLDPRRDPAAARMLWRALLRGGGAAAASPAARLRLY